MPIIGTHLALLVINRADEKRSDWLNRVKISPKNGSSRNRHSFTNGCECSQRCFPFGFVTVGPARFGEEKEDGADHFITN